MGGCPTVNPSVTRLTASVLNSTVYSCFGIFFIFHLSSFQVNVNNTSPLEDEVSGEGQASANAKKQLKAAGLTEKEIKCIMNKVNAMIKKMCPGMTNSTELRIPGS